MCLVRKSVRARFNSPPRPRLVRLPLTPWPPLAHPLIPITLRHTGGTMMSLLVDAVCTAEAPEDDSSGAAEILNLLREHRAAAAEEQDDDMEATGADDADDADDDSPRPWTREDDELLRKLAAARAPAKREGGKEKAAQLDMHEWGEVAEHFDDRTPLECAHRYQKFLSPDNIKGARRR